MRWFTIIISLFICSAVQAEYESERFLNELSEGMHFHEVLNAWGAPDSKIEQEAKRVDIWVYEESRVRFYEGRLVSIEKRNGSEATPVEREVRTADAGNGQPDVAVADILNEIMDSSE